jgi:hypothetical protein
VTVHGCTVRSPLTGYQVTSRPRDQFSGYSKRLDTFRTVLVQRVIIIKQYHKSFEKLLHYKCNCFTCTFFILMLFLALKQQRNNSEHFKFLILKCYCKTVISYLTTAPKTSPPADLSCQNQSKNTNSYLRFPCRMLISIWFLLCALFNDNVNC